MKKKLRFEDAEKFALRNLLVPQQTQLSKLIKTIYDISELTVVAPENRGSVIFWQSVTKAMAKAKLCAPPLPKGSTHAWGARLTRVTAYMALPPPLVGLANSNTTATLPSL